MGFEVELACVGMVLVGGWRWAGERDGGRWGSTVYRTPYNDMVSPYNGMVRMIRDAQKPTITMKDDRRRIVRLDESIRRRRDQEPTYQVGRQRGRHRFRRRWGNGNR